VDLRGHRGGSQNCGSSGWSNIGRVGLLTGGESPVLIVAPLTAIGRTGGNTVKLIPDVQEGWLRRPSSVFA